MAAHQHTIPYENPPASPSFRITAGISIIRSLGSLLIRVIDNFVALLGVPPGGEHGVGEVSRGGVPPGVGGP